MTRRDTVITGSGLCSTGWSHAADLLPGGEPRWAGDVDFTDYLGARGLRYKDRATKLALSAASVGLRDAGLLDDTGLRVPGESVGVVVSSNFGNLDNVVRVSDTIHTQTVTATRPMDLPSTSSNVIASWVAIWFGLRGPNVTLCNGASSGLDAVHWGSLLVAAGRAERVVVIGVEPTDQVVRRLLGDTELFDGGAALVLESSTSAKARGCEVLARVGGYGRHGDVAGSVRLARGAHDDVGLWLTPEGGSAGVEVAEREHDLSTVVGHASGALGALQCVAAVEWLRSGRHQRVLATAGGAADDGITSLVLGSAA